jgi:hypothetical protein
VDAVEGENVAAFARQRLDIRIAVAAQLAYQSAPTRRQ